MPKTTDSRRPAAGFTRPNPWWIALTVTACVGLLGCGGGGAGLHPESLPTDLQTPYALFAARCSRCHTLSRPLNAPVHSTRHWELYVARMRRMPNSGINEADGREILRFLRYYTTVIRGHDDEEEATALGGDVDEAFTGGGEEDDAHES